MTDHASPSAAKQGISTQAVHAGEARQKPGNAITDPIFCAATYTFADTQAAIDFVDHKLPREEYGRYGNPRRKSRRQNSRPSKAARRPCCIRPAWRPWPGSFWPSSEAATKW